MSSQSDPSASPDLMKDKWISVVNHMHSKHTHAGTFKKCAHGTIAKKKNG